MKYVLSICVMLVLSMQAYGQQAERGPIRQSAGTQVDLQLRIIEVSPTKLRRLGFDLTKLSGDSDPKPDVDQANGNAQAFSVLDEGSNVLLVLDSLRQDNLAKVLAEPKLATRSGKATVFNLGDKVAIPKQLQDGSVTMEQQHAIVIRVTPEVSGDKVHLVFHGQLAELDREHPVRVGKKTVPGVRIHQFTTRAELKSGQTLMFRGPTQTRVEAVNRGVPYVSEIPYVGAVLRVTEEQQNEITTFISVRPEFEPSPAVAHSPLVDSDVDASAPDTAQPVDGPELLPRATARRAADNGIRQ